MKLRIDARLIVTVGLVALMALVPLYLKNFPYQMAVMAGAFFYAILASSWSLLAGIAGQFSFAHMAFVGVGAYTAGLMGRDLGSSPLVGIIAGTLLAGLVGLIIGILCLRLRAAYLALFTIAFPRSCASGSSPSSSSPRGATGCSSTPCGRGSPESRSTMSC